VSMPSDQERAVQPGNAAMADGKDQPDDQRGGEAARSSWRSVKCRSPGPGMGQRHVRRVAGRAGVDLGQPVRGRAAGWRRAAGTGTAGAATRRGGAGRVCGTGPAPDAQPRPSHGRFQHVCDGAGPLVVDSRDESCRYRRAAPRALWCGRRPGRRNSTTIRVGQVQRGTAGRDDQVSGPASPAQRGVESRPPGAGDTPRSRRRAQEKPWGPVTSAGPEPPAADGRRTG